MLNPRVGRCRPGIRFRRTRRNFTKVVTLTSVANMLNKMSIRFCKNYFVRATTLYCNQVTWLDSTKKSSTRSMSHPESCIFVLVCTLIQNDSITNFTVYFDCRQCWTWNVPTTSCIGSWHLDPEDSRYQISKLWGLKNKPNEDSCPIISQLLEWTPIPNSTDRLVVYTTTTTPSDLHHPLTASPCWPLACAAHVPLGTTATAQAQVARLRNWPGIPVVSGSPGLA